MSEYKKVFWELRYEVWKVSFLNAFLSAAIAFFISNVICTFMKISVYYSIIPAVVIFLWSFIRSTRKYTLRRIEEGNPEVAEILRTAHDNSGNDDLMVHALFLELMQKMETVSAGVFVDGRKTTMKLLVIALLAFAPLTITPLASKIDLNNRFTEFSLRPNAAGDNQALAPVDALDDAGDRDIYGDKDIITLGSEKLDIAAASGAGGVDFSQKQDTTGKKFNYNDYPIDVQAEQTDAGTGGKTGDQTEGALINDYSCKTKGTCAK